MGLTKSGLDERHAAIVRMGPKHRKTVPSMSIYYTVRIWHFGMNRKMLAYLA